MKSNRGSFLPTEASSMCGQSIDEVNLPRLNATAILNNPLGRVRLLIYF